MKRGTCIHYRGSHQEQPCAAGVDYSATFGPNDGIACRAPCIQEYPKHEKNEAGKYVKVWMPWPRGEHSEMPCDKRVMPTGEEIAEADAEWKTHFAKVTLGLSIASKWKTWTKKNRVAKQEVVECPACKGKLHLSQAAYNGHVHGQCETKGCISWME